MSDLTNTPTPPQSEAAPIVLEQAWFARRFPVGHPSNAMGPVHWKGWATLLLYVGATLFGAGTFLVMAIAGLFVTGVILFVVIAFGALLALLIIAALKGDDQKTVEDYAKDKQRA